VRTLLSSPKWMLGFCMSLAGLGFQVLALSHAPLSVVQPIIAAGIVVLLVLSHFILHEHLGTTEWWGVATVGAGLLLVGLSLDTKDRVGTSGTVGRILVAAVPTAAASAGCFALAMRRTRGKAPLYGVAAGFVYGVAGLATKGVSVIVEQNHLIK